MARGVRGFRRDMIPLNSTTLVTYYIDNGTEYEESVKHGENVLIPSTFTPTKSGYSFVGWREDTVASDNVLSEKVAEGKEMSLYAVFSKAITLTKYNGSTTASTDNGSQIYNNSNLVNPSFTLTLANVSDSTKVGWTNSDSGYTATVNDGGSVTLSSDATYYSLYKKLITVTYYNNSSTASTATDYRIDNYHSSITNSNPTFRLTVATVSGWTIRGWSTSSSASGAISYNSNTNFTRSSDCTLYASWSKTVTVSYNGNGNTSGSTSASTGTAYRGYKGDITNASITLRANGFTKTSNTFYRWRTGASSGTIYAPSATYSTASDTTLYAFWLATSTTFNYSGSIVSFVAYANVNYYIKCYGAQGGSVSTSKGYGLGGYGGRTLGYRKPSSNETWYIGVGGSNESFNGGYKFTYSYNGIQGAGGGGASHVGFSNAQLASTSSGNVICVAGGGGGGAAWTTNGVIYLNDGGAGGNTNGSAGSNTTGSGGVVPGGGASQTAGGSQSSYSSYPATRSPAYGTGGVPNLQSASSGFSGGGGGAGWYGGGAGYQSGGGGGGSGNTRGLTSATMASGQKQGNGQVIIEISSVS